MEQKLHEKEQKAQAQAVRRVRNNSEVKYVGKHVVIGPETTVHVRVCASCVRLCACASVACDRARVCVQAVRGCRIVD